jgi:mono/diheme cytochrome c family protein
MSPTARQAETIKTSAVALAVWVALSAVMIYGQADGHAQQPAGAAAPPSADIAANQALLKRYCISCHNEKQRAAGLSPLALDSLDLARVGADAAAWEKVVTKLRTASMPPAGIPRPAPAASDAFASWLENELDRAAAANPNPGQRPPLHRLNRAEYQNAVRDLLALDNLPKELDISSLLPADDASYGFDNIADALGTSPTLLERYLVAAQKLSALAVGDRSMPLMVDTYRVPLQLSQDDRIDGLPFGTRGGISFARTFPIDGEYNFQVALNGGRAPDQHQLELSIDGERVRVFTIGVGGENIGRGRGRGGPPAPGMGPAPTPPLQVRQSVKAGSHVVTVAFVKKTSALAEDVLTPFSRSGQGEGPQQPSLASVTIAGPYSPGGPGDTASRRRIFSCHPDRHEPAGRGASGPVGADRCAQQILSATARRAYRRETTADDLQTLMAFYRQGQAEGGFEKGIQRALERMLVSPWFLFRVERDPAVSGRAAASRVRADNATALSRISDFELASRLSFFLWSSIPDDELLDLAAKGLLTQPAVLERQVVRMLADARSKALISNFAGQWLTLRDLDNRTPDPRLFPDFDENLRRAMRRETELFFEHVVRENRSVLDFLTANYSFVNERLAKHYGLPNVYGDNFRRVALNGPGRRGLLGHASILTVTSYPHRTSPVLRGKFLMDNILGTPPPPPPPNVPTLVEKNEKTLKTLTMREAMAQHRADPSCSSCHSRMDPLGFAFENFDAVGRFRTVATGVPVDASGALPDGTSFDGASGLIDAIMKHPRQFATTLTERLLTYALGRGLEHYDAPAVRAITREAAAGNYRFASLVTGVVKSMPFQMRAAAQPAAGTVRNGAGAP